MDAELTGLISTPYATTADVRASIQGLEQLLVKRRDRRAIFASAYRDLTGTLMDWIEAGHFQDGPWTQTCIVSFANIYRDALVSYEAVSPSLPYSWKASLEGSQQGRLLAIQDLLLGMNAHINHDLPYALYSAGLATKRELHHDDYVLINQTIEAATGKVKANIVQRYSRGLGLLDQLLGSIDDLFASFSIRAARENAWLFGTALTDAKDPAARRVIEAAIDRQANLVVNAALLPSHKTPWLVEALKEVDRSIDWFTQFEQMPT